MLSDKRKNSTAHLTTEIADQIALVLQGIRFGSIEIVIHDGKVVQIERREKLRFDAK
ncbi:MAG: YezD family protein [Methylococcaceae bacterium]|nr:YezD family protein [Methylococcaceae bacterium]